MALLALITMLACCSQGILASSNPIKPADYVDYIGTGFTTHYFKTLNFTKKYKTKNIADVKEKGFRNLRLRCRQDLDGFNMSTFLTNLETVVDDCLAQNVTPIISWIHHEGEAIANETHRLGYLQWWTDVATKLKDKDYRLSFNLFTELGIDYCLKNKISCKNSLKRNIDKYNNWTTDVVKRIRGAGGNNDKRIIILGSPEKTAEGLPKIDPSIYQTDSYMMVEWHIYASGPNKKAHQGKYWEGDGEDVGKKNVDDALQLGKDFMNSTGLFSYFAEWMPIDNNNGRINQSEAISFTKYFLKQIKPIPWSLNSLGKFYNTKKCKWIANQTISGQTFNMSKILEVIIKKM